MIEFIGKKSEELLFQEVFEGKKVVLHVRGSGEIRIEVEDGELIDRYVRSGRFMKFVNYLGEIGVNTVSL